MVQQSTNRSRLMLGCGAAAMAMSLLLAPDRAAAQGAQATPNVTQGAAFVDRFVPGQDTVTVDTNTVVIDWTPDEDAAGNALDFLPTNNTLIFQNGSVVTDFSVLNRILPSTNGNIAVIDGTVISQIFGAAGAPQTGGFVAFYSPTGLLIGNNAVFDVGSLMLTTLDPDPTNFGAFSGGGFPLSLSGTSGTQAPIIINGGAQINALQDNAFFVAAAADIQMRGTARVNGSHAYVAGEIVTLTFNNGLFDIQVPVGSSVSQPITIDGTVGGPASTGVGDDHMIYAVSRAINDPITLFLRGNLGFDPAVAAGVVNGEIIISANYDVTGRTVDGGSVSDGINAEFDGASQISSVDADIMLESINATSSLLAIGTDNTVLDAAGGQSSIDGNLMLVGRQSAEIRALAGVNTTVTGDVLVSSRGWGAVGTSFNNPSVINAQGGFAAITAVNGGNLTIDGDALVTSDAQAGADIGSLEAGTAQGGTAQIEALGGNIAIIGETIISARALGSTETGLLTGADSTGGLARLFSNSGGSISLDQALTMRANAIGADTDTIFGSTGSQAFGGQAELQVFGGAQLTVSGVLNMLAGADAGLANTAGQGALADGGEATIRVSDGGTSANFAALTLDTDAAGGTNQGGGQGGNALGGASLIAVENGASLTATGDVSARAAAQGGNGTSGGNAEGGAAGVRVTNSTADLQGNASLIASAIAGGAFFNIGGTGGNALGGAAYLEAVASPTLTSTLNIGLAADLNVDATGGSGGFGDGSSVGPGAGGNGSGGGSAGLANQADTSVFNGAFVQSDADNGSLTIGESTSLSSVGTGGTGGSGNLGQSGAQGGTGTGGSTFAGLVTLGGTGAVGLGTLTLGDVSLNSAGIGGSGGFGGSTFDPRGDGGAGSGGDAFIASEAGDLVASGVSVSADGTGGEGQNAGVGTGGDAGADGALAGTITLTGLSVSAQGIGGFGEVAGGAGNGGSAFVDVEDAAIQINGDVTLNANGRGGLSFGANGANGTGGSAGFGSNGTVAGSGTVTGNASITANGFGGDGLSGFTGGDGQGGQATIQALAGTSLTFGSAQVTTTGAGTAGDDAGGGSGFGGTATLRSNGTGSQITILGNTPTSFEDDFNLGAIVAALGIGAEASGGNAISGNGTGGSVNLIALGGTITLPASPETDPNSADTNGIFALGIGGNATLDAGVGTAAGDGIGGTGSIDIDGGTINSGRMSIVTGGDGGSGTDPNGNIAGAEGLGGVLSLSIVNGATLSVELVEGSTGGIGGNGIGTGNGGRATGGTITAIVSDGTLNLTGSNQLSVGAQGGDGEVGGQADNGNVSASITGSTINFAANALGEAELRVGGVMTGGAGQSQGGDAENVVATLSLNTVVVNGGRLVMDVSANGGAAQASTGTGGVARGGDATFSATQSQLNLQGISSILSDATGGAGDTGGAAFSGNSAVTLDQSTLTISANTDPATLLLQSLAQGGDGTNTVGQAASGTAQLSVTGSSITAEVLSIEANAISQSFAAGAAGGEATGGTAQAVIDGGSTLDVQTFGISSSAQTSFGGTSFGGLASLQLGPNGAPQVDVITLTMDVDGQGGDPDDVADTAGRFEVVIEAGELVVGDFNGTALGDVALTTFGASEFDAAGGNFLISGSALVDVVDDFLVNSVQGNLIGGPLVLDPSADITIVSQGAVVFTGDDDSVVGVSALRLSINAFEVDIEAGARIGATTAVFNSLDFDHTAVLGGTTEEVGFTLTEAELLRLTVEDFTFNGPILNVTDPDQADIAIRNAIIPGSLNGGASAFSIIADGIDGLITVEGTFILDFADTADTLSLSAGERIEVIAPGGIGVLDGAGLPSGTLTLESSNIWIVDDPILAQLRDNAQYAGRDAELAAPGGGTDALADLIVAGGVEILVSNSLFVRNTGTATEQGGITVGAGGLIIRNLDPQNDLDVFAYGRRDNGDGTFTTGEPFFDLVNFDIVNGTTYGAIAAFNDCIINTGECPTVIVPPDPVDPPSEVPGPPITNPIVTVKPAKNPPVIPATQGESDSAFGIDFPGLIETPLVSEEPFVEDPVASGGDTTLYGQNGTNPETDNEQ